MNWDNYFKALSMQYRIEINQMLKNAIREHFDENLNIYTEQDMYEQSRKIIQKHKSNNIYRVDVHFSIYGATADVHDAITQTKCSFENLLDSIRKLSKCDVNLIVHVVCMRENETDILSIYKLLSKLGIKTVKYDEIRNVFGMSQSEHAVSKSKLNIKKPNFSCSLEDFNNSASHNTCWCGKCVISTNGDVFPCEFERNIKYGNVLYDSLADILMTPLVQECWNLSLNKIPICKECEFRFACKDCRPLAYGVCGNIFEKNPRCKYNPFKGIWK